MKDLLKFIKSTGVYLAGNVLIKAISFFMLPLYTKYLNPAEYGTYDLNIAYITFISSILFLDIWGVILRYTFDYKDESDKSKPIFVGMIIFIISTVIYIIAVIILGNILKIEYKILLLLLGLITNSQQVVGYIARSFGKNFLFALSGLIGSFITIICNILFIAVFKLGYQYLYIATCIGLLINTIIIGINIDLLKHFKISNFKIDLFKDMYIFAAPLCVNSVAYWFLTSYNKLVINNKLSVIENGLYAAANKFNTIIQLFIQCFQMAWQELSFSKAGSTKEEMDMFYNTAFNEYIKFLFLGLTIIIPFIKIIFPYMVDNSYRDAINIIPFSLLATVLAGIASFLGSICSTIKKNKFIFLTTVFGSIINVIIINLLITPIGVQAASISLFIGYLIVVIGRLLLVNKFIFIKVKKSNLFLILFLFCIVCYFYFFQSLIFNAIIMFLIMCITIIIYKNNIISFCKKVTKN